MKTANINDSPAPPLPHQNRSVLTDDFLSWLRFVNAGMLDDGNIIAMDYAIARMPAAAIVEIGSFCGLSSNVIAHLRRRHGKTSDPFFAADPWIFEGTDAPDTPMGDGGITFGEYRELVKISCVRNLKAFSRHDLPHTIESASDAFFEGWREGAEAIDIFERSVKLGGEIGFAYIDGDHRYEQALKDFQNIDAHITPGGFILFDDSADGSGWEVCRVIEEIGRTRNDYEVVDRFPNYLVRRASPL